MIVIQRLAVVSAVSAFVLGCGGGEPAPLPDATASADARGAPPATLIEPSGESTSITLSVTAHSSPNEVVLAFLNAMRDGNSAVASALLTDQARAETTKHQWPVQPPGAPSATYQLGQPSFVDQNRSGVHVPCVWAESDGAGGTIQFEVVWALRRLEVGWRVAGFATEIVQGKPPFYFNFEDIANLKETQALAEAALAEAAAAEAQVSSAAEAPAGELKTR